MSSDSASHINRYCEKIALSRLMSIPILFPLWRRGWELDFDCTSPWSLPYHTLELHCLFSHKMKVRRSFFHSICRRTLVVCFFFVVVFFFFVFFLFFFFFWRFLVKKHNCLNCIVLFNQNCVFFPGFSYFLDTF